MSHDFTPWPEGLAQAYRDRGYWSGLTLDDLLRDTARRRHGHTAIVDGARRWSYTELDRRVDRMAAAIHALGFEPGDRVLVQLPNIAEFAQLFFALQRCGVIPVLALPAHREFEIVHLAELSGARAYAIADRHQGFDYRTLARTLREKVPSVGHVFVAGDAEEFTAFAALDAEPVVLPSPSPSSVAVLLLSGGTTGLPKLIPRTHDDYHYNARESARVAGLDADTRYLAVLPIAHNFPLACPGILGTLHVGGTVVMCADGSPETAQELVERERITDTALIPPLVLLWLEARAWVDANLDSLRWLQVGGARLNPEVAARIRPTLGCRLQQVYGMAEGLLCFTRHDDTDDVVVNTQGRPLSPDDELRIVDENDHEVAPGGTGELQVRGPYTLRGYWRAEEYNRRAFTADGYYRSGDVVRRTPDGDVVVEGRNKDVVNRGGEKVPVEEVENLLLSHPAVLDVAIVGIPDDVLGERTCTCVLPRGEAPTLPALKAHLNTLGVAAFKLPDRLVVLDAFPSTKFGKVNRRALASQILEGSTA
ncbi:MAG: 2,3-dihydroxybenzoate-AMP ligase [Luteibacter sp.]|uniref:(2,3-dihydroxybenzoyl)adenylate synthase n=1 Tax=Luteibacter sp. TaxID=1886636 RepID=UPI00137E8F76|nr:AMP-binding protein [Luteibacter sp.]KAF1007477.1 MAG: 2,3-dihydroxybenzoate-AMP ligase [Luteibacter sp.]